MNYTFATVFAFDQAAAQSDFPEYFQASASADGLAPATAWLTSGPFSNEELQVICNQVLWQKKVYFGNDPQAALAAEGLMLVQEQPEEVPVEQPQE